MGLKRSELLPVHLTSDAYRRDDELHDFVELCNMCVDGGLKLWNPKADADDQDRVRLQRLFGSKSMMAGSELLWKAICARLDLHDTDEQLRVFYRPLSSDQLARVRKTVQRLYDWQRWNAPKGDAIDNVLSDKKTAVMEWFRGHGLSTGYLMGALFRWFSQGSESAWDIWARLNDAKAGVVVNCLQVRRIPVRTRYAGRGT